MMIGMILISVVPDVVLDVVVNVVPDGMIMTTSSHTCEQIVSSLEGRNVPSSSWSTATMITTTTTTSTTTVVERIRPHVDDTVDGSSFDDDDQDFEASSWACVWMGRSVDGWI
jgi:hypothetical protein